MQSKRISQNPLIKRSRKLQRSGRIGANRLEITFVHEGRRSPLRFAPGALLFRRVSSGDVTQRTLANRYAVAGTIALRASARLPEFPTVPKPWLPRKRRVITEGGSGLPFRFGQGLGCSLPLSQPHLGWGTPRDVQKWVAHSAALFAFAGCACFSSLMPAIA